MSCVCVVLIQNVLLHLEISHLQVPEMLGSTQAPCFPAGDEDHQHYSVLLVSYLCVQSCKEHRKDECLCTAIINKTSSILGLW